MSVQPDKNQSTTRVNKQLLPRQPPAGKTHPSSLRVGELETNYIPTRRKAPSDLTI